MGPHPGILDWYTVIGSLVAVFALAVHGALYLAMKTEGALQFRAGEVVRAGWLGLVISTVVSLVATVAVRPSTLSNYMHHPIAFIIPAAVAVALGGMFRYSRMANYGKAFLSSSVYLAFMLIGAAVALYPALLPSSSDASRDITIAKALAGPYALSIGLIWWTIGILVAIGYFVFVYRMFRGKVTVSADEGH